MADKTDTDAEDQPTSAEQFNALLRAEMDKNTEAMIEFVRGVQEPTEEADSE